MNPQGQPYQQQAAPPGQVYGGGPATQPVTAPQHGPNGQQAVPPPATAGNPNSTQNTLQIAEIRDGIVIMNDGSYRAVIMAKSINFDLMSQSEQESVEYAYQGFLNSLYFPIQIFIRSQKVDIGPYIDRLDKIRTEHDNMLLALLMEDYINYIDILAQSTNIMDKKFYIVVPFASSPAAEAALATSRGFLAGFSDLLSKKETRVVINERDLDKAKTELKNRVQAVTGGLIQCGVKSAPLDTEELIELYYDTYNPDTATRQHIKNFQDLTVDVVTKGEGQAPRPHLQGELN